MYVYGNKQANTQRTEKDVENKGREEEEKATKTDEDSKKTRMWEKEDKQRTNDE